MNAPMFAALVYTDTRLVWRDPLLKWILLLPVGLALLLRVVIPRAHGALLVGAGFDSSPYHPLVLGGYLMTAPGIVGMVTGFLLLDELDAHTLTALRVTPLSRRRYLGYRVTMPLFVTMASTLVGYSLIGIVPLTFSALLAIAVVGALSAPLLALVLVTAAPNKVAGLAVVKVLNGVNLLPVRRVLPPDAVAVRRRGHPNVLADARILVSRGGPVLRRTSRRRDDNGKPRNCRGRVGLRAKTTASSLGRREVAALLP